MTKASPPKLLTPAQVAARFSVSPKTVTRWAKAGLLPFIRTPRGHRRYPAALVEELAAMQSEKPAEE